MPDSENPKKDYSRFMPPLLYLFAVSSCLSISATYITIGLMLIVFLLDLSGGRNWGRLPKDFLFFVAIYAWRGITILANGLYANILAVREIGDKAPYLIVGSYKYPRDLVEKVLHALFITNSLLVVYGILQRFFGVPYIHKYMFFLESERFVGYFGHPMHYSGYISLVILLCFALTLFHDKRYGKYLPFLATGLILSVTRTYFMGTAVGLMFLAYHKSKKALLATAGGVLGAILATSLAIPSVGARFTDLIHKNELQMRFNLWDIAWDAFKDNPIFGVGYQNFSAYLHEPYKLGIVPNIAHAHNIFINNLVESGILGFVIITSTLFYFTYKYYRGFINGTNSLQKAFNIALGAGFINIMVAGMFESNFGSAAVWMYFTYSMGLCEGYGKWLNSADKDKPK